MGEMKKTMSEISKIVHLAWHCSCDFMDYNIKQWHFHIFFLQWNKLESADIFVTGCIFFLY